MPKALAVVTLDVLLVLELVSLLVVPLVIELLVPEAVTEASVALPEAPKAFPTVPIEPIGPNLLFLLLLLLPERLNLLLLLLIPSQIFLGKIIQGRKAKFVSNLKFVILIVYFFLGLLD